MIILGRQDVARACGVCHRTLLLGERAVRYSPGRGEWLDVCPLCLDSANEHGWIREGSPTTPLIDEPPRRRRRFSSIGLVNGRQAHPEAHPSEPILRRLSRAEQEMVEAAELFNASPYRRTVAGIARSLGNAQVSLLPLSGTNPEVVVTVAWDISWYQYRVGLDSGQAVKLAERGYEPEELDERFRQWNAFLDADGRITPDIPKL